MQLIVNFCTICLLAHQIRANSIKVSPKFASQPARRNLEDPVFLTPLIEQGKIEDAIIASKVSDLEFHNISSYSGYLTVNKAYNSNLFFWYFPSQTNQAAAPVVLWLQGGPGATSLIGLFVENGPFTVKTGDGLNLREFSWTKEHNVIYIDNPVGSGYSFTNGGYAQNQTAVGEDLYNALQQFFQLFPELQRNEFYVSGESYAGKYVPAISYTIHKKNPSAELKINLQGLTIGSGLSDPVHQLKYADYLYQIGLIDSNDRTLIARYEQKGINYIQNEQWTEAFELLFDFLLDGSLSNQTSLFTNITGFNYYFNYLTANGPDAEIQRMNEFLQRVDVREAIHVGNNSFNSESVTVKLNLKQDFTQSVAPWISELLSHYPVLIYNGQLDIVGAYPLTVNYLQNLQFSAADEYKTAERHQWWVAGDLAGYVKVAGNLTEVLVRNAGHMAPRDQPQWMFDLITRFTHHQKYF